MTKTFTENDLLRFLYNDIAEEEKDQIEKEFIRDLSLQDRLLELQSIKQELDRVGCRPSRKTTEGILNFSRDFEVQSA